MNIQLRDYQVDLVELVRQATALYRRLLMIAPTGAGKTICASHIIRLADAKGLSVLFLAHRDTLIRQTSRKLREYGVEHGIIMAGNTQQLYKHVQVGSVQTMVRRLGKHPYRFHLIIIDEAHLSAAKSYRQIVEAFPDATVIGLTGSPCRLDGKGLGVEFGGLYEHLVQAVTLRWLIDNGYLVQPDVYASRERLDLSGIKKVAGEYETEALAEVMDKPVITGSAVEHYQRICPGKPAVAWCVNVAHAQHVADQFNASGIPARMLSGDTETDERDRVLGQLATGEVKVVTFCQLLVEGVDVPDISAVIILRPTHSLSAYLQTVGRGLRAVYAPGFDLSTIEGRFAAMDASAKGRTCLVLDHAGVTFRHGFVDDEREWTLEGAVKKPGKKKDAEQGLKLKQCPECWHIHEPAETCPKCGHIYETRRELETVEGELTKVTPEMRKVLSKARRIEVARADSLETLQAIAEQRGYQPSWAENVWRAKSRRKKSDSGFRPEPPLEAYMADLEAMGRR